MAPTKEAKKANPLTVTGKNTKVRYKKLKKKPQTVGRDAIMTVSGAQGDLSYALVSAKKGKKSFAKKFSVNARTGDLTLKKKTRKGKYTVQLKVTAAGNQGYKAGSRTVTVTIKVK